MILSRIIGFFAGSAELYAEKEHRDGAVRAIAEANVRAKVVSDGENGGIFITLSPSDAKKISPILDKFGIIVYINNVRGIKNICITNVKRIGLLLGAVLFLAMLALSTLFVFKVEVSGSELISKEQIKSELSDFGIRVGARLSEIDRTAAANRFMQIHPEYSWAAVNFKGTTVCLELKERTHTENTETKGTEILVAECDGVIREVLVYSGKATVKAGDVVKKGDLLISGYISGNGLQYSDDPKLRFDGARGSVKAEVAEELAFSVPFEASEITCSEIRKTGIIISLFGFELTLGDVSDDESGGYAIGGEKNLSVMGAVELPITYRECTRTEETSRSVVMDEAQAAMQAEIGAYALLNERLADAELTEIEVIREITESGACVTVKYGCIREIAAPLS